MIDERVLKNEELYIFKLRSLFAGYGYSRFKMSKFEEYDLYAGNKRFLVSDHVITFTDTTGKLMALKPDVTLSVIRNCPAEIRGIEKTYYDEKVYRVSRSSGCFKEITQIGIECMGQMNGYSICEVLMLAAESLRQISRESLLTISNLEIVFDTIREAAVSEETGNRMISCIAEKNLHELTGLCKAAEVAPEIKQKLETLVLVHGSASEVFPRLAEAGFSGKQVERLQDAMDFLSDAGYEEMVRIDFSVISDRNYYNGIVFHGFVNGVPSLVLSGGCYDQLMQKMGKKSGAIGFAVYLDELERMAARSGHYDADVLLLYQESDPPQFVRRIAERLRADGKSVYVCTEIPNEKHFKTIYRAADCKEEKLC